MKRKGIIVSLAGMVVLGGAFGVSAASKTNQAAVGKQQNLLSVEEAKQIALNEYGGTLKSIELETDDGYKVYEIDLLLEGKYDEVDIEMNAVTGEILYAEIDDDDKDLRNGDDSPKNRASEQAKAQVILKEEAISLALKDTDGIIKEAGYDDGAYEIEVLTAQQEVKFEIHALTGEIMNKEIDNRDHDE
ncbi:PepSY domain-containing protein [Siminovitchia sediminis]|uniref:PepSY domain-containing protein n=1 Tax=Siminovitchia sediminis TaxID=1274353 RepID=A0ABW4KFH7_9BACI